MKTTVVRVAAKARRAEQHVLSAARAWFESYVRSPGETSSLRDRTILALGLDMEARSELRAAQRRWRRATPSMYRRDAVWRSPKKRAKATRRRNRR